jgi:hypothetical protein
MNLGRGSECVDTNTDPSNCGGCALAGVGTHVCTANQLCVAGVCEDYAPALNAGCAACPCAACATALDYASCCGTPTSTLGVICLNGATCP